MASPLANALASDEYAEFDNPLVGDKSSWRDEMSPDYETEPDEVTLGEDGNYYANDNRWNYGEWVTYTGDEPVYWVEGGAERDKVDEDQWEYDEFGNVVTKDADFSGNGKALNPNGQWMTEQQIRDRWDASNGMSNFRKANPNMSVDDYMGLMKESTALKAQGIERLGEGGISPEYQALYDKYGLETSYTGSDGAVYEWNGGGYTITQNGVDMGSQILHGAVLGILGAGLSAGLAGALAPTLGASGAKAASTAITNLAKQYMTTGDLSFEDALLSAALAYGGAELSEVLSNSGVVADLSSQFDEIAGGLISNGGDVLTSALQAGGMSLVTQMVKDGEIDWKDAAIAAAMAGGTTALQGFLGDIGKSDEIDNLEEWDEYDEWQQEAINADIKDPFLNPNYESVGDGLVMNINTGEVFGQGGIDTQSYGLFDDLDKDGDGQLSGSDLENIDVTHEYVSTKPNLNYNEYAENSGGIGRRYYVDEQGNVHSGPSIGIDGDGNYYNKIDGTKLRPLTGTYDEEAGLYLFKDSNGSIVEVADKTGAVVSVYDPENKVWTNADGTPNAEYNAYLSERYNSGSTTGQSINDPFNLGRDDYNSMTGEELLDDYFKQYAHDNGENMQIALTDGQMQELVNRFGNGKALEEHFQKNGYGVHYTSEQGWRVEYVGAGAVEDGIYGINHQGGYIADIEGTKTQGGFAYYDPDGNPVNVNDTDTENPFNKPPPKVPNKNPDAGGGGSETGAGADGLNGNPNTGISAPPSTPSTGGPSSSGSFTPEQLATIANLAGSTVEEIIDRLDSGETAQEIMASNGTIPITNNGANTNNNGGATNPPETPNNGTDTNTGNPNPTPNPDSEAYEARVADLMARGMSRDQAEANMAHALKAGADLDGDGIVYDAEWAEFKGIEPNNGNNNSGNNTNGNGGNGENTNTDGNTNGNNNGGNENGNPDNNGGGNTDGNGGNGNEGDGNNEGNGEGDGSGDGNGDGSGAGSGGGFGGGLGGIGMLGGGGDNSNPTWGPLFPAYQFKPKQKSAPTIGQRLFADLFEGR